MKISALLLIAYVIAATYGAFFISNAIREQIKLTTLEYALLRICDLLRRAYC
jgi:hypothetical protein